MHISFAMNQEEEARCSQILKKPIKGLSISSFRDSKEKLLSFKGSHKDFVEKVLFMIDCIFIRSNGQLVRPKAYVPDDERLYWREDLQAYLRSRGSWKEYREESTSPVIPLRFVGQHLVAKTLSGRYDKSDLESIDATYGEAYRDEVKTFLRRFGLA